MGETEGRVPAPVRTGGAPEPLGPYSQAMLAGGLVMTAGQTGLDPESGELAGGAAAQTERALRSLRAVLEAAGSGMDRLLRVTLYLADMSSWKEVNEVYSRWVCDPPPARVAVEVSGLPGGALVEIAAVAVAREV